MFNPNRYRGEDPPAYSPKSTKDSYAYEQQVNLEIEKGLIVNISESPAADNLIPTSGIHGDASEPMLRRGLQMPTKSRLVSSGFRYRSLLAQYGINEEQ